MRAFSERSIISNILRISSNMLKFIQIYILLGRVSGYEKTPKVRTFRRVYYICWVNKFSSMSDRAI
nr:MAG TPA: hypothetical protein [Caudoviricetes sp.]